jgi:hypothetical protein
VKGRARCRRQWSPSRRRGGIDLKKGQSLLWDEFDREEGVTPGLGYLAAPSRQALPDQAPGEIVSPDGPVSPGKKGTA